MTTLQERLAAMGSVGTCSQCGSAGPVLVFRGGEWCVDCRARALADLPDLPEPSTERRPEVVVEHDGDTYRFPNKAEARRAMRAVLRRQRLPSGVSRQIERAR